MTKLLLALLLLLPAPALADTYAVLDKAGVIQNIIVADDKTPCTVSDGCTLVLLSQVPIANRGVYGAPQPAPTGAVCEAGSVRFDGNTLTVCSTTGQSTTTMPGPLVKPAL